MSDKQGGAFMANYKLGLNRPLPEKMSRSLRLEHILKCGAAKRSLDAPLVSDHYSKVTNAFQMYNNDKWGICGPAAIGNQRGIISAYLTDQIAFPTQDAVTDLYVRATSPSFNPVTGENDNGVILQTLLETLLEGGIGGVKPVCFARLNTHIIGMMDAAISLFGSVILGVELHEAQSEQTDTGTWDYVYGSPIWGGHAITECGYDQQRASTGIVETWSKVVKMTKNFQREQISEAWVVMWAENFSTKQFQDGIDIDALKEDYKALTDKDLILPA